jgi:hypothetical protein
MRLRPHRPGRPAICPSREWPHLRPPSHRRRHHSLDCRQRFRPYSRANTPGARAIIRGEYARRAAAAYGADLGSAVSVQALRARWAGIRTAHPELFAGMQAVVMLNETARPKHAERRLVVGPLQSPGAAVELCATLATFRLSCQPTSFAGQHLALQ